jgi:hypothetical protein
MMSDKNLDYTQAGAKLSKPIVCSYDAGNEHSVEHYAAVRRMVEEEEADRGTGLANDSGHDIGDRALLNDPAA